MQLNNIKFPVNTRWIFIVIVAVIFTLFLFTSTNEAFRRKSDIENESLDNEIDNLAAQIASLNSTLNKYISLLANRENVRKNSILSFPIQVQLNDSQVYRLAEEESNFPLANWEKWKSLPIINSTKQFCDKIELTDPLSIEYNNRFWQQFESVPPKVGEESIRMFLYNAYYDDRLWGAPVVKLITVNSQEPLSSKREWWCLLWFENIKSPIIAKAIDYYNLWNGAWNPYIKPGTYHPQLITCPVPKQFIGKVPRAVSLQSQGDCNKISPKPNNVLRVIYNNNQHDSREFYKKKSIGVCVQAFRFGSYDVSVRLVEWLEMMKLLGADKIYLYVYAAHVNMIKVLEHYKLEGLVEWRQITLAGNQINQPSLYNLLAYKLGPKFWPQELIELNDCLYRNLYRHRYLAVIDIDEVIMPQKVNNWHELIDGIESGLSDQDRKHKSFYSSRHSHVCEVYQKMTTTNKNQPIPEYLYMSRHIQRGDPLLPHQTPKCFVRTDLVTAVHNHYPLRCLNTTGYSGCKGLTMDLQDGVLLHYRRNQSNPKLAWRNHNCSIEDRSNWRYFDRMLTSVAEKLENIFS